MFDSMGNMGGMGNMYGGGRPPPKKPKKPKDEPVWKKGLKDGQVSDGALSMSHLQVST
jgi:hypothetical protein